MFVPVCMDTPGRARELHGQGAWPTINSSAQNTEFTAVAVM